MRILEIFFKLKKEIILTFLLLFFSLVGYIPTWPYMLSNSILLILPALILLSLNRIRFTNNILVFSAGWMIISIVPYILNSIDLFRENPSHKIIIYSLKFFGVLFASYLGYNSSMRYKDLSKILYFIFILNFILMSAQFFIFESMKLEGVGSDAEWVPVLDTVFWKRQVGGLLGNSNAVGSFVLFTTIFLYDWLKQNRNKLWITLFLSIIAIVFYAKSRNNIIVGVFFISYSLLFINKKLLLIKNISFLGLISVLIIIFSSENEITDSIFKFSSINDKVNSLTTRLIINQEAIKIWWNHLFWFGGGFGTETYFLAKFDASRNYSEMLYTKYLLEMGVIGSVFSASILYVFYKNKIRSFQQKKLFNNLIFIIFFVSFFETVFYTQQLFYFVIFILAWLGNHSIDQEKHITLKLTSKLKVK